MAITKKEKWWQNGESGVFCELLVGMANGTANTVEDKFGGSSQS